MTVAQLHRELGPDELVYWEALIEREPLSHDQQWLTTSALRAEMNRINTGEVPSLRDLMPDDPWSSNGDT